MRIGKLALLCVSLAAVCTLASAHHAQRVHVDATRWVEDPDPSVSYGTQEVQVRGWPFWWVMDDPTGGRQDRFDLARDFVPGIFAGNVALLAFGFFSLGVLAWVPTRREADALPPWGALAVATVAAPSLAFATSFCFLALAYGMLGPIRFVALTDGSNALEDALLMALLGWIVALASITIVGPALGALLYRMHRFRLRTWMIVGVNLPALPLILALSFDGTVDDEMLFLTTVACLSGAACGWAFWWIATRASPEILEATTREALD